MNTRVFAFGCSFTKYKWPTWADYLGVNFDEYYNFAQSGGSNSLILYNFIKALDRYNFNSEQDYIVIMFTSHHRYSFMTGDEEWSTHGDVLAGHVELNWLYDFFRHNLWSIEFGILQSWVSAKCIKEILINRKIKHKFLSMDSVVYPCHRTSEQNLVKNNYAFLDKFQSIVGEEQSMTEFILENNLTELSPVFENNQISMDSHPSTTAHFKFFQKVFSEQDTELSRNLYNEIKSRCKEQIDDIRDTNAWGTLMKNVIKRTDTL